MKTGKKISATDQDVWNRFKYTDDEQSTLRTKHTDPVLYFVEQRTASVRVCTVQPTVEKFVFYKRAYWRKNYNTCHKNTRTKTLLLFTKWAKSWTRSTHSTLMHLISIHMLNMGTNEWIHGTVHSLQSRATALGTESALFTFQHLWSLSYNNVHLILVPLGTCVSSSSSSVSSSSSSDSSLALTMLNFSAELRSDTRRLEIRMSATAFVSETTYNFLK